MKKIIDRIKEFFKNKKNTRRVLLVAFAALILVSLLANIHIQSKGDFEKNAASIVTNDQNEDSSKSSTTKDANHTDEATKNDSKSGDTSNDSSSDESSKTTSSQKSSSKKSGNTTSTSSSGSSEDLNKDITVTIEIRCDSVSGNNALTNNGHPEKEQYASNPQILYKKLTVKNKTTVYQVLISACTSAGIQYDASFSSEYNTTYVSEINHLREKDASYTSGWTYYVNGKMPPYGCSAYKLSDGDKIVWNYVK